MGDIRLGDHDLQYSADRLRIHSTENLWYDTECWSTNAAEFNRGIPIIPSAEQANIQGATLCYFGVWRHNRIACGAYRVTYSGKRVTGIVTERTPYSHALESFDFKGFECNLLSDQYWRD